MRFNFTFNKEQDTQKDLVLQVTALTYLQDALVNERYEECADLVRAAKEYGATLAEIRAILAEAARGNAKNRQAKTPARVTGRKRI